VLSRSIADEGLEWEESYDVIRSSLHQCVAPAVGEKKRNSEVTLWAPRRRLSTAIFDASCMFDDAIAVAFTRLDHRSES
jgi:hypothetical protein